MFLTPEINTNHAQLIFTTHDAWEFFNERLRKDEIWVTEKDERGGSTLQSVAEFKDEVAFTEKYLSGRYGGSPDWSR